MPAFKPKVKKKIHLSEKASVTLDSKHNEKMEEFKTINENILPKLKKEYVDIKIKLKKKDITIDNQLNLKDRLKVVKGEIKNNKSKKNDYLLQNSKLIFEYFEKKNICQRVIIKPLFYILSLKKKIKLIIKPMFLLITFNNILVILMLNF